MTTTATVDDDRDETGQIIDTLLGRWVEMNTIIEYAYQLLRDHQLVKGDATCMVAMMGEIAAAADDPELAATYFERMTPYEAGDE